MRIAQTHSTQFNQFHLTKFGVNVTHSVYVLRLDIHRKLFWGALIALRAFEFYRSLTLAENALTKKYEHILRIY